MQISKKLDSEGKTVFRINELSNGTKVIIDSNGNEVNDKGNILQVQNKVGKDGKKIEKIVTLTNGRVCYYDANNNLECIEDVIKPRNSSETETIVRYNYENGEIIGIQVLNAKGNNFYDKDGNLYAVSENSNKQSNNLNINNSKIESGISNKKRIIIQDSENKLDVDSDNIMSFKLNNKDYKINTNVNWWYSYSNNGINVNANIADPNNDIYNWNQIIERYKNETLWKNGGKVYYNHKDILNQIASAKLKRKFIPPKIHKRLFN